MAKGHDSGAGPPAGSNTRALDRAVADVGRALGERFRALLAAVPGAPHRPQELARTLGVNKDLSSRILKATESQDPIAIVHAIPGPDPLRRLIRAAARRKADRERVEAAEAAVTEFEHLIREIAGDRAGLDTIISAWLPEVREKSELLSKQAVFKGMSHIKGTSAELEFVTRFVHPAASGQRRDYALLSGYLGLRRLRPGARIAINSFRFHPQDDLDALLTLDGDRINASHDVILEPFCSAAPGRFQVQGGGEVTTLVLEGEEVGQKSAADITWAHVQASCNVRGVFSTVNLPTRRTVCDLFVHRDIAPRIEPLLEIYDTMERGVSRFRDPARELDRLDLRASIERLGEGPSGFRCIDIPRYMEMIEHVCARMQWRTEEFIGYRCAIDYPVYGAQIWMVFDPQIEGGPGLVGQGEAGRD